MSMGRKAKRVVVLEWQRLSLPAGLDNERTRYRLLRATEGLPFDVFILDGRGLRTAGAVGLVDIGDLQIEILPKVRAGRVGGEPSKEDARYLLELLTSSGAFLAPVSRPGRVVLEAPTAIEVMIRAFAEGLLSRLTLGGPRRYHEREEVSTVLRGRPDLKAIALRRPGTEMLIPTRYAPLQLDNPVSRLVLALLQQLSKLTCSARTWSILKHCESLLPGVTRVELSAELVARIQLTSLEEEHWADAVEFARALTLGRSPSPVSGGRFESRTVLFPLDDIFEAVVRRSLSRALEHGPMVLALKRKNLYLLRSLESGQPALSLRPDFLFLDPSSSQPVFVADAKWKRLESGSRALGLSSGDVYQVVTYMLRHGVSKGALLFPMESWMLAEQQQQISEGTWSRWFVFEENEKVSLTVVGVDVEGLVSKDASRRSAAELLLAKGLLKSANLSESGTSPTH